MHCYYVYLCLCCKKGFIDCAAKWNLMSSCYGMWIKYCSCCRMCWTYIRKNCLQWVMLQIPGRNLHFFKNACQTGIYFAYLPPFCTLNFNEFIILFHVICWVNSVNQVVQLMCNVFFVFCMQRYYHFQIYLLNLLCFVFLSAGNFALYLCNHLLRNDLERYSCLKHYIYGL